MLAHLTVEVAIHRIKSEEEGLLGFRTMVTKGKSRRKRAENVRAARGGGGGQSTLPPPPKAKDLMALSAKLRRIVEFRNSLAGKGKGTAGPAAEAAARGGAPGGASGQAAEAAHKPSRGGEPSAAPGEKSAAVNQVDGDVSGETGAAARAAAAAEEAGPGGERKGRGGRRDGGAPPGEDPVARHLAARGLLPAFGAAGRERRLSERKRRFLEDKKRAKRRKGRPVSAADVADPDSAARGGGDHVPFGEVVQAPPRLLPKPRGSKAKGQKAPLKGAAAAPARPRASQVSQERLRQVAVNAYRQRRAWETRPGFGNLPRAPLLGALDE